VIRYEVDIRLTEVEPSDARQVIEEHHRLQPYTGDFFLGSRQLEARHLAIEVDGQRVGLAAVGGDGLSLCTVAPPAVRLDRQILETVLSEAGATQAYAASWDRHHLNLFGNFATGIDNQTYQFELLRPADLRPPLPGVALSIAGDSDLDYLRSTGFLDDSDDKAAKGELRVARLDGRWVGIGVAHPHPLRDARVDIGMYTDPPARRTGIGRSILALTAQQVLASGGRPTAGCWWANWQSRRTLESAGLTCIGTIFRLELDPGRFRQS
jgi:GNAT superfamily N-acetyltransferase